MKKNICLFVLILFILTMTSCSKPQTSETVLNPQTPVTITLWHYYVGDNQLALESIVADFNQTEGIKLGIIVEPIAKGNIAKLEEDVTKSAMGFINAESMPQLFSSYPDKAIEINDLDMLLDLNPYFSKEERDKYVPSFLQDGIYENDRFLLIPIAKSTELLFVNDTEWLAFAQNNGYDQNSLTTWEGLYDTAHAYYQWTDSKTKDIPLDGKAFMGFDSLANYIIIGNKQLGVNVIDSEKHQVILNTDVMRKIFEIYYKGYSLGYFDAVGNFRSDDIKAGNIIAYVGSSSSAAYFPTWIEQNGTQMPIKFLPIPYPSFRNGEEYVIQQGAGMCVSKSTPAQQEGSVIFLKWFTDPARNIKFAMSSGYLPVQSASFESKAFFSTLNALRNGELTQKNVANVYDVTLHQIIDSNTYIAKPFKGSYNVRSILESTLLDIAKNGRNNVQAAKAAGANDEEALIKSLEIDTQFENWLDNIRAALESLDISYLD